MDCGLTIEVCAPDAASGGSDFLREEDSPWFLILVVASFLRPPGARVYSCWVAGSRCFRPRSARASELKQAGHAISRISQLASTSAIASYNWANRNKAPAGYIKGMAVSYAKVYYDLGTGNVNAIEMAKAQTSDDSKDALKHYEEIFQQAGMDNSKDWPDTLRHLFVLMLGHGMRESSGRYCEGRDRSAHNTTADTAEAGVLQTSFNARHASPLLPEALQRLHGESDAELPGSF